MSSAYAEFPTGSVFALFCGTLIYAWREFYIVMSNIMKFGDGLTGYINYGLWIAGDATVNPAGELVKAVLKTMDPSAVKSKGGRMDILEIGCGLGQPAIDAAHYFGSVPDFMFLVSRIGLIFLGSNASITGISINQKHVDRANNLAKANSLSSRISHQVLNAADVHTLDQKPFGAAYSVEVLSEIQDPYLQRALSSLHAILLPGAEFSFADLVRTKRQVSHDKSSTRANTIRFFCAKIVTMMLGDHWRTPSTMEALLSKSGFEVVSVESVGDRVFVPTWYYAKERMAKCPDLGINFDTSGRWHWFTSFVARCLSRGSLEGLALLWEAGEIDYIIVKTKKKEF
jgi:SAM-dependent methyltransferase